jgi:hypothetical protein
LDSTATPVKVEKMLKRFKTHRCAMDFDSSFCKAVFHNDNGEIISGENGENVSGTATSS